MCGFNNEKERSTRGAYISRVGRPRSFSGLISRIKAVPYMSKTDYHQSMDLPATITLDCRS